MTAQRNYRLYIKKFIGWKIYQEVCFHELNPATGVLRIQQLDGTLHIIYGHKLQITLAPEFIAQEIQAKMEEQASKVVPNVTSRPIQNFGPVDVVKDEISPEEVAEQVRIAEEGLERWRTAQKNTTHLADSNEALSQETTTTFAN